MLKDKMSKYLLAGGMALTGLIVGIGAIASAQTITNKPTTTPVVQTANTSASASVDTPESANDPADSDRGSQAVDAPESANDQADSGAQTADIPESANDKADAGTQTMLAGAISSDEASKIAVAKVGGTVTHVGIDDDTVNGHAAYEVKANGKEVKIDGLTGAIVEISADDQH